MLLTEPENHTVLLLSKDSVSSILLDASSIILKACCSILGLVLGSACFFANALINLGFSDSINSIIVVGYLSLHAWFPVARKWILPYLYIYELIGLPGSCFRSFSSSLALFMVDINEKSCHNLEMTLLSVQEAFIMESVSLMAPVDFFINSFLKFLSVILQAYLTASNQPSNLEGSSPSYTSIPANRALSPLPGWNMSSLCMHPSVIAVLLK